MFNRRRLELRIPEPRSEARATQKHPSRRVLVINASEPMARAMTVEIERRLPGCEFTYAPTLATARIVLNRHAFSLIVSDAVLPDGRITALRDTFSKLTTLPDVIVVGQLPLRHAAHFEESGYHCTCLQRLAEFLPNEDERTMLDTELDGDQIAELGASLRNDLNNPLQEIVAMVFVAKMAAQSSPSTDKALSAIARAAQGMATVVNGIEEKIRTAVV